MTSNSLTGNEEHGIPSHILKTIFGLRASVILETQICAVSSSFVGSLIPDPRGQLAEIIVYITSTRVDLYSHEMLFSINVEL